MLENTHQNRLSNVTLHAKVETTIATINRHSKSMNPKIRLAVSHLDYKLRIQIVLYIKFT